VRGSRGCTSRGPLVLCVSDPRVPCPSSLGVPGEWGTCGASEGEMRAYLNSTRSGGCPSDWPLVQRLLFTRGCSSLPRRCRAAMAPSSQEAGCHSPLPSLGATSLTSTSSSFPSHHSHASAPGATSSLPFHSTLITSPWYTFIVSAPPVPIPGSLSSQEALWPCVLAVPPLFFSSKPSPSHSSGVSPVACAAPCPSRSPCSRRRPCLAPNVRWEGYRCSSFACLNARFRGECLRCFNMTLDRRRWQGPYRRDHRDGGGGQDEGAPSGYAHL